MSPGGRYARVVVDVRPAHLDRPFDYLVPEGMEVAAGMQVRVPFAGRQRDAWVVDVAADTAVEGVKPLLWTAGPWRWFDPVHLALYRWVAERYAGTLASVLRHAVPPRVARVDAEARSWTRPPPVGPFEGPPAAAEPQGGERVAPPCPTTAWRPYGAGRLLRAAFEPEPLAFALRVLPHDDPGDLVADLVARCVAGGRTALVVVPDPARGPADAALAVAGGRGVDLRGANDAARYRAFLTVRAGHADVVVGERGAALLPVPNLGLVAVVDEANPAYKERRAPRHHAREVALAHTRLAGAPCVLLTDVPSAHVWRNAAANHLELLSPNRAVEREHAPIVEVVEPATLAPSKRRTRLADPVHRALTAVLDRKGTAVVLVFRRGEGSVLICPDCGQRRACPTCGSTLGYPSRDATAGSSLDVSELVCPVCGHREAVGRCSGCGGVEVVPLAAGAGRLAAELGKSYPAAEVVRMEGFDAAGPTRRPAVAVMTRGSVVSRPAWLRGRQADVVVVPDVDAWLARTALESAEDALRLWMAVGRWTQRLVLQTRQPTHPVVQALVRWDPEGWWREEGPSRALWDLPPSTALVAVTAPAGDGDRVAAELRAAMPADVAVLGPDLGGVTLLKAPDLRPALAALAPLRAAWSTADRRVRVDVDPLM